MFFIVVMMSVMVFTGVKATSNEVKTLENIFLENSFFGNTKIGDATFNNVIFKNVTFGNFTLSESSFADVSYENVTYKIVTFIKTTSKKCDLSYVRIDNAIYESVSHNNVILKNVTFRNFTVNASSFDDVAYQNVSYKTIGFLETTLKKFNLSDVIVSNATYESVSYNSVTFKNVTFGNFTMWESSFDDIILQNGVFSNCSFRNVTFENVTFNKFTFDNSTLENVNFKNVDMSDVTFRNVSIKGSIFSNIIFKNVTLGNVTIGYVTFESVLCRHVSFLRVTLGHLTVENQVYDKLPIIQGYYKNIFIITTLPPPTTTKSPEQLRREYCLSFKNYQFPKCITICHTCAATFLHDVNQYSKCREEMNGTEPTLALSKEPMLMTYYVSKFTKELTENERFYKVCPITKFFVYDRLMWHGETKRKLSDLRLPNYQQNEFKQTKNRWNKKNDTVIIPYGNIVDKGPFHLQFAMYEDLITYTTLDQEKLRLKETWHGHHPIQTGEYVGLKSGDVWLVKKNYVVNSLIITAEITPNPHEVLPTSNIIAFTHRFRNLTDPICVYWQPVKAGRPGDPPQSGYWTNYQMEMYKTNKSMTICHAYTFGTYAVMMALFQPPKKKPIEFLELMFQGLTLVSAILPIMYIAGMVLLKCYKHTANRIYIYIAFCFFMTQILTVFSFPYRDDWKQCSVFTGWIHFFYTSIFCWLMLEGIHRLTCITSIFHKKTDEDMLYCVLGLGFPLANAIAMQGFPYDEFDKLRYCWTYTAHFHIGYFIGPFIASILCTVVIKTITWKEIKKNKKKLKHDFSYQQAHLSFMGSVAIVPTIMAAWCLLSVGINISGFIQDFVLIIAPIVQIFVGLEILYFYFYRNFWVIKAFVEESRIKELKKLNNFSYLNGLPLQVNYKPGKYENLEEDEDIDTSIQSSLIIFTALEEDANSSVPSFKAVDGDIKSIVPSSKAVDGDIKSSVPSFEAVDEDKKSSLPSFRAVDEDFKSILPSFRAVDQDAETKGDIKRSTPSFTADLAELLKT